MMAMLWIIALVPLWLMCGYLAGGVWLASAQREFAIISTFAHYRINRQRAWILMAMGPAGLLAVLFVSLMDGVNPTRWGCTWRRLPFEDRVSWVEKEHGTDVAEYMRTYKREQYER